ncbi:MICOS complex subunit Mic60 isoform X3 [Athalia rosae]|uniref:MICOS complex subunit Mic60 isoform X3 n=1 Tax=Athalia rosae TaxID=37344 RepID=UPI002034A14C|nr:MICOS complex subunit Mic60 isoform X3 [Athalia rosae]
MFRIGLKFPCNGINRACKVKKQGLSRLYLTARYYETRVRIKCEPEGRLLKDVKLMSRLSGPKYSTESSKSEKTRGSGGLVTLGALTLGTLGILAYAKNDPSFRATLEEWVPGTNKAIRIIFQEEDSYLNFLLEFFESLKQTLLGAIFGEEKETPKDKPRLDFAEKPAPPPKDVRTELLPANLVELEASCGQSASQAIEAYKKAACAIQDYNKEVVKIVENSGNMVGGQVWDRLKEATNKRKEALKVAESSAEEALQSLKTMYSLIDDPSLEATPVVKAVARRNIKTIVDDVDQAKQQFEKEVQSSNITERYWQQVAKARSKFEEELEILFPNVNIAEKKFSVDAESFDLFVLHMYNKVNMLQKELERLQTVNDIKLAQALRSGGDEAELAKIEAQINNEINKQKRILHEEFSKKSLEEKRKFNEELRTQLKLQAQIHADHLRDALAQKNVETQRLINRTLNERVEAEAAQYKLQLAAVVGRLQGLDAALKARIEQEKSSSNAQLLWGACQTLARAVKVAPPGAKAEDVVRPLNAEIRAVEKSASGSDPLVKAVINGIPEEASKRGVFPEDILRERFLKVEHMARRLALVPEEGASLPIYLLSYLQNFLLVKAIGPIPKAELDDEPIDPEKLTTYDVLQRARYWVDRGNFKMTLRYMNLLKGASRAVANDWMNEARILLETQQAVDTLIAHAGAAGLVFLGGGDSGEVKRETKILPRSR